MALEGTPVVGKKQKTSVGDDTRPLRRLTAWASVDKTGAIFDLVFKAGVIVVALTYIFRPTVRADLPVNTAVFIDNDALQKRYGDTSVPPLVNVVKDVYNSRNETDIRQGLNRTLSELPLSDLCKNKSISRTVAEVYGDTACDSERLGTGHYYERYMLVANQCLLAKADSIVVGVDEVPCKQRMSPLDTGQLTSAKDNLQAAQYRRADFHLENNSNIRAEGVRIIVPEAFSFLIAYHENRDGGRRIFDPNSKRDLRKYRAMQANDIFLDPGESLVVEFRTAAGNSDPHTEDQFKLDWRRPERADFVELVSHSALPLRGFVIFLIVAFSIVFLLVVITDYRMKYVSLTGQSYGN